MDDPKYLEQLNFVVDYLHNEGFLKAHSSLLQELSARFSGQESELLTPRQSASTASAPPAAVDYAPRTQEVQSVARSKSVQEAPTWDGFPEPASTMQKAASTAGAVETLVPEQDLVQVKPAALSRPQAAPAHQEPAAAQAPGRKRSSRSTNSRQRVALDLDLDEYENMDDPGYVRRDVVGQQRFVDTELDVSSDDGSERNYFMHQPGDLNYDDIDSEVSASDVEGLAAGSYSGHFSGPDGGTSSHDAWDMGPMDIKFGEPVSTPSKSPEKLDPEERSGRPVLSRVESLSSSFKDFELERGEGEQISGKASEAEYTTGPEVIDFPVAGETYVNHEDVELFRNRDSRTSSLDVGVPSMAPSMSQSEYSEPGPDKERHKRRGVKGTSLLKALATGRTGDIRENGGFSFPVTPPSDEPDQRIFTSWPSVRSSCASEPVANSDDDNAAEYADEEYSKSKRSSRSTSLLHVPDLQGKQISGGGSGEVPSPSPPDEAGDWEFKPLRMRSSDKTREPSLEFSTANTDDEEGTPTAVAAAAGQSQADALLEAAAARSSTPGSTPGDAAPADATALAVLSPPTVPPASPQEPADQQQQGEKQQPEEAAAALEQAEQPCSSGVLALDESVDDDDDDDPSSSGGRKGTSLVDSHQISLTVEDLHEHSHGGSPSLDVSAAALSDTDRPTPRSLDPDPDQSLAQDQGQGHGGLLPPDPDDLEEELDEEARTPDGVDLEELERQVVALEQEADAWEEQQVEAQPSPKASSAPQMDSGLAPRYTMDEQGNVTYEYDIEFLDKKYEIFDLRVIHRRQRTGFEETKDFPIRLNDLIAGRYQVVDFLGSAAFSRAVQALDVKTGQLVCLKIIKNNKDYFDQSLDEIKLLKYVNSMDPNDEYAIVRLYDYFYYKEHLFLVCELLRANLYEFQKYNKESGDELYFTNARIQRIAKQTLRSLAFLHSLGLIHSDLKPENILIKSYSRCEVKVIDLGSSCFITDQLSSYVQSRSYRAPEVILGLPYDNKVDVWSLGCILAELSSGYVLFQNDSLSTLLARLEGILGPLPEWMVHKGRYSHRFYTRSGVLYERNAATQRYELLVPKRTSLRHRMPDADEGLLEFVQYLLTNDPRKRPTAAEALNHPWLQYPYPSTQQEGTPA